MPVRCDPVAASLAAFEGSASEIRARLDCGFGLTEAGGAGSRLVLEVRSHEVPFLLDRRQLIGALVYEPMRERPDILYGTSLGSN